MIGALLDYCTANYLWVDWTLTIIGSIIALLFIFVWFEDFISELNSGHSLLNSIFNRSAIMSLFFLGTIFLEEGFRFVFNWVSITFWDFVVKVI